MTREEALEKAKQAQALVDEIRREYVDELGTLKKHPETEPPTRTILDGIWDMMEFDLIPILNAGTAVEYITTVLNVIAKHELAHIVKATIEKRGGNK